MHPYLFSLPVPWSDEPFHLRSFGVLVALGFLFGAHLLQRLAARYSDDPEGEQERWSQIVMWILFGVFGGARLMYVIVEVLRGSETGHGYLARPWTMLFFWEGGLVMYGGLAGGIAAGVYKARKVGVRWLHGLDLAMIGTFFAQAIGRVGCLMVGDDYGSVVPERFRDLPFPVVVHVPDPLPPGSLFGPENAGQVLWATQPWMSLNALLLGFVALWLLKRRRYEGQVLWWTIALYAVGRFTIEVFRGDAIRGKWFDDAISTSQLISIVAGLIAVAMLVKNRGRVDADLPRPREGGAAPGSA
ncbi:MAG: prolipoprotein diacylglyceryl transferase [Planctomycetes bacterium]|nr:prolipoprotein diacylglyceryl transferase [Planctomycetota bacterium]